jgi:hypothetical protein
VLKLGSQVGVVDGSNVIIGSPIIRRRAQDNQVESYSHKLHDFQGQKTFEIRIATEQGVS